ncbi:hypothetical protein DW640_17165 [Bacteroides sp. AM23-12]|uniref:Uncharacterized protein n=1 Tax=Bacteroides thetaiotaomicron TaxID=818 RepID=A0A412GEL0_BACT4|nr:hypothetical protein DW640_17165 [Bacteroides sp. AM23-12]RGR93295.1 hypothetical protein DWY18_12240 [Bacteroides thetaiotaomicron]RGV71327.1 hypothetical protein DWW05_01945 [Bacteroides thetaiotaomicron]RGZ39970.1 hypothetical protein DW991_04640 [Bacteroides thetaiotaomicron]RHF20833.1 hypothetical protein DW697_01995 [Bacteroides thetaiotaomicron]
MQPARRGIFLWKYGITAVGHEDNVFSCSKTFLPYLRIKRKKMEFYLFPICVFVYLCVIFKSVT